MVTLGRYTRFIHLMTGMARVETPTRIISQTLQCEKYACAITCWHIPTALIESRQNTRRSPNAGFTLAQHETSIGLMCLQRN